MYRNGRTADSKELRRAFADSYQDIRHDGDALLDNWLDESAVESKSLPTNPILSNHSCSTLFHCTPLTPN